MISFLAQVFIGWPVIIGSLAASIFGITHQQAKWLLGGAALSAGFAWYLTRWPNPVFAILGYLLPLLHVAGAMAVQRRRPWIAWTLLVPHAAIATYLAVIVLSQ